MNKCPYCGGESVLQNARGGFECSGCGYPRAEIQKLEVAPLYALKINAVLTAEIRERLSAFWENQLFGTVAAGRIVILDSHTTIEAIK